MTYATKTREAYAGNEIRMCAIINARCGNCSENCAFCAQSGRSKAAIDKYPMKSAQEIFEHAKLAEEYGAVRYGIVTSGRSVQKGRELDIICEALELIRTKLSIVPCGSLGILSKDVMQILKKAGLDRCHHNLETAESHFAKICQTRNYTDQIRTVTEAKEAGLSVCSGGIFGLGETDGQRIEFLSTLRSLEVNSIPINFLNPIPGTPLENATPLTVVECLRIIATARLMMPETSIRICGGREKNLRDFQSWLFAAGADSFMTGGYLVTAGRDNNTDKKMIEDAGLTLVRPIDRRTDVSK